MTLGCQDAQHRTGVPLGSTVSNTEVLCCPCTQAASKPVEHLLQCWPSSHWPPSWLQVLMCRRSSSRCFSFPACLQPCCGQFTLGSCSVQAFWEVGRAERRATGVHTACGGTARAACYLRAHRPSFHHGHRGLAPCLQQAGRTEVFPVPDVLGIE